MTDELKPGHCHKCGLQLSDNPHPEAGKPSHYLQVGCPKECIPCLTLSRHQWAGRAMKAENELAHARKLLSATQPAAVDREAVAWQVRRADGRIDGVPIQWEQCTKDLYDATLSTGRYAGYENGPRCEVRALYAARLGKDASKPAGITKEWCMKMATLEPDDGAISAGAPSVEQDEDFLQRLQRMRDRSTGEVKGTIDAIITTLLEYRAASTSANVQDKREANHTCPTCKGMRVVDDGEITGSGGVEYENGPIKCVKDCPDCAASTSANTAQGAEHPDDVAVDRFMVAMKEKLAAARSKGRGGWQQCDPTELSVMLREHVEKGDPRDVANFCMFLWNLGHPISDAALPMDRRAAASPAQTTLTDDARDAVVKVMILNGEITEAKHIGNLMDGEYSLYTVHVHCQCTDCKTGTIHASDCSVHNAPALPVGECDCGAALTAAQSASGDAK